LIISGGLALGLALGILLLVVAVVPVYVHQVYLYAKTTKRWRHVERVGEFDKRKI
jgi:4-hydroxybenzoate polyprenyltransferase